jgi:GT2 family glycosyltransferase
VSIAPVSVIVRTIGRPTLLESALKSLAGCDPQPAEVLVVDQSDDFSSMEVMARVDLPQGRPIRSRRRGRGLALNEGLRNAGHDFALVVDDDCTVRADWVGAAHSAMLEDPDGIISGRVLPGGPDPRAVPSTICSEEPRDYTGDIDSGALYCGNMACPASAVLAFGGFDEIIRPVAEDCDLCYRWLAAGRRLRYVPDLVVWHHDWRAPEELSQLYVGYAYSRGMFYAKHLRRGDLRMLRYLAGDYHQGLRSLASRVLYGTPRWADQRRGVFRGVPPGLWAGWRQFGRSTRLARRTQGPG